MNILIILLLSGVLLPREYIDLSNYDAFMYKTFRTVHRSIAEDIERNLQIDTRILEIAFGAPYLSIELATVTDFPIDVVIESSLEALITVWRLDEAGLTDRIRYQIASIESLPFPDETFDIVLARDAMRFWYDNSTAFSEIDRVLRTGGLAMLGSGLEQVMSPDQANVFWERVQDWRNTTDHRPWAATLPFPEKISAALDSAGISGYRVWNEGYCTCRTSAWWRKGMPVEDVVVSHTRNQPPPIGERAPDFTLTDYDENPVTLSSLKDQNIVVDFWSIGCRSCFWLMRYLGPLHQRLQKLDVAFLAINVDPSRERAHTVAEKAGLGFHVLLDGLDVARLYGVQGLPHVIIIDRAGRIRARFLGGTEDVAHQIESTLLNLVDDEG